MEAYIEKFLSFDWDRINNITSIILLVVIIICVIIRLLRNSSTKNDILESEEYLMEIENKKCEKYIKTGTKNYKKQKYESF